jgi:diaminopimelate epimerase
MTLQFIKMEGLGNDFLLVDCDDVAESDYVKSRVRAICDRRMGAGADGVICVLPPSVPNANFRMRIFNADGGEAEMCGNGVRCVGEYLRVTNRPMDKFALDTLAGLIEIEFAGEDDTGGRYRVNMGVPRLVPDDIPVVLANLDDKNFVMKEISVLDKTFKVTAVSMGNPHAVIYDEELSDELVLKYGPAVQRHTFFPKSVNVEFVKVISDDEIRMRVYERGCGETLACGTGACAAVVSGVINGMNGNDVIVHLTGGILKISWDGDKAHPVYMEGPARTVFSGTMF